MNRRKTREIQVGNVTIGGDAPVAVQSMCNTDTRNAEATLAQIERLKKAGCKIVRVAVVDKDAAHAIGKIVEKTDIPIVADIHFDSRLAVEAAAAGASKIRINPGNIGDDEKVRDVVNACRARNIPIRIGVNGGSLEREILEKYGVCARGMVESAKGHVKILNKFDFDDICISVKASSAALTVDAYRMLSDELDYPLHLGVTEAGTVRIGRLKSAIGIGSLLLDGIGDTIRVSLTDDPVLEVETAYDILHALGMSENTPSLVSCPTCGRCMIDLIHIAKEVENRLSEIKKPIKVAVMGCVVNGPGEAREADIGMAGGKEMGLLFRHGEIVKKVPMNEIVDELMKMAHEI
ncbi:MAG: flavodoxin-dependent (E)-4-hydroxy-3-methylbut-2-enyl-diphosphate synthase [Oscillospiraceae bacterium]|nr:flavodoxin-dependent (E)-4-hydroxy-3-methylbut-2-enyl-diphosphate synthase [Oscillospiraceae bacterium]